MPIPLLTALLLLALPVYGYEFTVKKEESLFIPILLPEAKSGGGDFYTIQVEPSADDGATLVIVVENGVRFRSIRTGVFDLRLYVNHVTKSSCAGVEVKRYLRDQARVSVVE